MLQASSATEKEELQKHVAEAHASCEQYLVSLQEAQAAAAAEAKMLNEKTASLTSKLDAAKVRSACRCYVIILGADRDRHRQIYSWLRAVSSACLPETERVQI